MDRSDAWFFRDYVHGILGFELPYAHANAHVAMQSLTSHAFTAGHSPRTPFTWLHTTFSGQLWCTCKIVKDTVQTWLHSICQ